MSSAPFAMSLRKPLTGAVTLTFGTKQRGYATQMQVHALRDMTASALNIRSVRLARFRTAPMVVDFVLSEAEIRHCAPTVLLAGLVF